MPMMLSPALMLVALSMLAGSVDALPNGLGAHLLAACEAHLNVGSPAFALLSEICSTHPSARLLDMEPVAGRRLRYEADR